MRRVDVTDGCWLWTGLVDVGGYGKVGISIDGKPTTRRTHRVVYEALVGSVPKEHDLHHTCRVPRCCNPRHLVPVTRDAHAALHRESRNGSLAEHLASPEARAIKQALQIRAIAIAEHNAILEAAYAERDRLYEEGVAQGITHLKLATWAGSTPGAVAKVLEKRRRNA